MPSRRHRVHGHRHAVALLGLRRRGDQRLDQVDGTPLLERPDRITVAPADDGAPLGLRRARRDPGRDQRLAVHPGDVMVGRRQRDRAVGAGPVEPGGLTDTTREHGRVVAATVDPRPLGVSPGVGGHRGHDLVDRRQAVEVQTGVLDAARQRVDVAVAEARQEAATTQVDDLGPAPGQVAGTVADGDDAIARHRQGVDDGTRRVGGEDGSVAEHERGGQAPRSVARACRHSKGFRWHFTLRQRNPLPPTLSAAKMPRRCPFS